MARTDEGAGMDDGEGSSSGGGVVEVGQRDIGRLLAPATGRRQPMRGFDPEYADIVDYIVRCTHRIWEEKAVGLIYTHYRHNALIHLPGGGAVVGREAVVAGTLQTLQAFPDRRLYGDAVVWSGDDAGGFYTSHRITNTGTNTGPTAWGPATGRRCVWRGVADCVVLENRICEEWLVRDDMHLVRQLGFDPHEVAARLAEADHAAAAEATPLGEIARGLGQLPPEPLPPPAGGDAEALVAWHLEEIWNRRMLDRVRALYARHAVLHGPVGRKLHGPDEIAGLYLAVFAALPDAAFAVDHLCHIDEPGGRGTTVAARWTIKGTHDGPGLFGTPSGKRVEILGISHHRLEGGRVAEEWHVTDELSVLRQIRRGTG